MRSIDPSTVATPSESRAEVLRLIGRNLGVLDMAAFALCRDQKLPLQVFSIFKPGALKRVVMGEPEGTRVTQ